MLVAVDICCISIMNVVMWLPCLFDFDLLMNHEMNSIALLLKPAMINPVIFPEIQLMNVVCCLRAVDYDDYMLMMNMLCCV